MLSFFFCLNFTEPSFATSASIGISGDANVEQDNPVTSKTLKKTVDINVSTNSYTGYELLMSSETNQNNLMPSKTDNHSHIDSVSADTAISNMHNQYGYNVKDINDDIYSAIPKLSTPLKIKTNPDPVTETVKFNLGFGLDNNLPTDNYKNKLIFTLLAKETMTTTLKPGRDINVSIRKAMGLSGEYLTDLTKQVPSDGSYYLRNFTFGRNKCSDQITAANTFKISTDESSPEAYLGVYKKDGYYYPCIWSETDVFIMNRDLSYMFAGLDTFSTLEYEFTDGYTNKNIDFSGVKDVSHIMHNMGDHYLYGRALSDFANKWHKYPVENAESAYENITDLQVIFDLTYINTDSLKNTKRMFKGVIFRELWLHESKFAEVEDASSMFEDASLSSADFWINKWTFENTKNFSKMFKNFNINYFRNNNGTIRLNKAEDLSEMFMGANTQNSLFNDGISYGGEYIRTMESMYENYKGNINVGLDGLNIAKAANIKNMFKNAKVLTITLPKVFNTLATTDMSSLFENCTNLTTLKNFDQIDTDNVTNMSKMFYNTTSLHYADQIAKVIKANNVTDMSYMFYHARAGGPVEFNNEFNTNTVKNMKAMFAGFSRVDVNISHFRFDNLEDMSRMFMGIYEEFEYSKRASQYIESYGVTDVIWPAKHLAPKLKDANSLFRSNAFIRKIKAPKFTAPNLKDLQFAFYGLVSVTSVDLDDFDTSAAENMKAMFCYIENGFDGISDLTINLDTSSVTNMSALFYFTNLPRKVNLSSFNTKNVTDMSYAFGMLNQSPDRAIVEEIDITGWDTSNVTNVNYMFGLSNINKIYASDSFVTTKVTTGSNMFYRSNITGQNGTSCYGWSSTGARFDNPPTSPGCFWHK